MKAKTCLILLAFLSVFVFTACAPQSPVVSPSTTPDLVLTEILPTQTLPHPMNTPTPSPVPTQTPTPTAIPTATMVSLSEEEQDQLLTTYKAMLLVQINTSLLEETASQIQSGELSGFEAWGAGIVVAAMVSGAEEEFAGFQPSSLLSDQWQAAEGIHKQIANIVARWFEDEIDSSEVLDEMESLTKNLDTALSRAESILADRYGIDPNELRATRDEMKATIADVFATPTAIPEGAEGPLVILSHRSYEDDTDYTIVGEVQNTSTEPMAFVKVIATLYDEQEEVVGTSYTYTLLDTLPPGGKAPFEITVTNVSDTSSYKLQVQGQISEPEEQALSILSYREYLEGDTITIVGEVQNQGTEPATFVKVIATSYDRQGEVVTTGYTYTHSDTMLPGGKSPFRLVIDHGEMVNQLNLKVQGQPGEMPGQDLTISSHRSSESGDYLTIQGEVTNNGDAPVEFVKIVITLYDTAGDVVGEDYTYTTLDQIAPGGASPFEISIRIGQDFDHYAIEVQGQ